MDNRDRKIAEALTAAGHKLKLDSGGKVDFMAMDYDDWEGFVGHNGPVCEVCGESWCEHCLGEGDRFATDIKPCAGPKVIVGTREPHPPVVKPIPK